MAESWNDQGWHTYTHDGVDGQPRVVTCHSKIIGGVLCRWWGDGPQPEGVAMLDSLASGETERG